MVLNKINRILFEVDRKNFKEMKFDDLVKTLTKKSEKEINKILPTLDKKTRKRIQELIDGGLL